ncbi:MAG TPA: lactate dehydrogenase, partial [Armatimonadota bacterium]
MKVSIVGAAGRVGSNAAFAIQLSNKVRELLLVDVFMADAAAGEALDLRHGSSLIGRCKIHSGGYDAIAGSDLVVVTAGLRRRPDESRLDLINRNVQMFKGLMGELKPFLTQDTLVCVVSNPIDILTYIAAQESGLPDGRVFGSGTFFDTTRFRSTLAEYYDVDPLQVDALLLGEHGDSMVPVWSRAAVAGIPLKDLPGYDQAKMEEIFQQTKTAGAEVIR